MCKAGSIFNFDESDFLGTVREVDTRNVVIFVDTDENLRKAMVGKLIALQPQGAVDRWLIGMILKVMKSVGRKKEDEIGTVDVAIVDEAFEDDEVVINSVKLTLVGLVEFVATTNAYRFTRSIPSVPEIDSDCYILQDVQLEKFMNLLRKDADKEIELKIGNYSLDEKASAYLDGNKFFQRHAALLGSTGSGKSWAIASILERANNLNSSNIIVFDLHGEYHELSYAKHLRIPGPEELNSMDKEELLYLPFWVMSAEEMQMMFVDNSEFNAHNQVTIFQNAVLDEKKNFLALSSIAEFDSTLTLNTPIPFSIVEVVKKVKCLNVEMVEGARGEKQGPYFGKFERFIIRLDSRISDKRYGFLFELPDKYNQIDSLEDIAKQIMSFAGDKSKIKVIDFSEVPAEILPVVVSIIARIIYSVQFWTCKSERHPLALICDEAHLYIPTKDGKSPVEQHSIEMFEKIAKEGRKYGVSIVVVSQRPSDISPTVLSQCNNLISLRLTNPIDQNTVKRMLPESYEGLLDMLSIMDIGEALVIGDSILLPSRIKLTPPEEKPISATIDFWTEWGSDTNERDFGRSINNLRKQRRIEDLKKH